MTGPGTQLTYTRPMLSFAMGWIPDLRKKAGQLTPVTPYQTFYSSSVLRVWRTSAAACSHEPLQPINGRKLRLEERGQRCALCL
jgi:hypothetical protein